MHANHAWATAGIEPRLSELLSDPILHLVLRRDRLTLADVHAAVGTARARLGRPPIGPSVRKSAA